jgi:hypothetical protein
LDVKLKDRISSLLQLYFIRFYATEIKDCRFSLKLEKMTVSRNLTKHASEFD